METWWAAAAALAALVGGGIFARDTVRRSRLVALAATAAGDHQNCAIKFNLAERPIPLAEAARRYDRAFASLDTLAVPEALPGATVLDRHSCVFGGQRFAHVVFRYKNEVVSLLVTNGDGVSDASPSIVSETGGLRVAAFDAARHAIFVVSDLPYADTLQVARTLAPTIERALSGA